MGRHGGGSRSGGSSSRSSSSSRGGSGGGTTSSRRPFKGAYRRSYVHRGRTVEYYTTDESFGTKSGWNIGMIFILAFITLHMCLMLSGVVSTVWQHGAPINGDKEFIDVVDNIDFLSEKEENDIKRTLYSVYEKSGMPVLVYVDNFEYKQYYYNKEAFSEDIYYTRTLAEDCMVIMVAVEDRGDILDWEFDIYCGDDTYTCLSDKEFDNLIEAFHRAMYQNDIAYAVEYAWDSIMDELAETEVSIGNIFLLIPVAGIYSLFYIPILGSVRKRNVAYRYFKEHPEELSNEKWEGTSKYAAEVEKKASSSPITCRWCGTENPAGSKTCKNCRSNLET